jgi:hypothetical protein
MKPHRIDAINISIMMQQQRQRASTDSGSGIEMVWYLQSTTWMAQPVSLAPQIRII